MNYAEFKSRLVSMFVPEKLEPPGEWGFLNETGRDVGKIAYATNLTPDVIRQAAGHSVGFILTHHDAWDFIYGMKDVCRGLLEEHGISHAFFHAPLDDADFGTSASLAAALNLQNCHRAIPVGIYTAAVIGELPEVFEFEQMNSILSGILGETVFAFKNGGGKIRKVCVATGGGMMTNDMKWAVDERCDAYITRRVHAVFSALRTIYRDAPLYRQPYIHRDSRCKKPCRKAHRRHRCDGGASAGRELLVSLRRTIPGRGIPSGGLNVGLRPKPRREDFLASLSNRPA